MIEALKQYTNEEQIPGNMVVIDGYTSSIDELFSVMHPEQAKDVDNTEAKEAFIKKYPFEPVYISYPWRSTVLKTVPAEDFLKLRTARNRHIIMEAEQYAYRRMNIGVAGLSVGSAVVDALVQSGGPQKIKLADFDVVELTNLNRIKANALDIGVPKIDVAARRVWELDPFAELVLFRNGLEKDLIPSFVHDDFSIDVCVDEMDSIPTKIHIREYCREQKIPVIMATDNGDSVVVDVERFDEEPGREIFHGRLQGEDLSNVDSLTYAEWAQLATKILDFDRLPERMAYSLSELGTSIPAIPQLGPTASMAGSAIAYVVRKIANKQPMPSGRYVLSLDEAFKD